MRFATPIYHHTNRSGTQDLALRTGLQTPSAAIDSRLMLHFTWDHRSNKSFDVFGVKPKCCHAKRVTTRPLCSRSQPDVGNACIKAQQRIMAIGDTVTQTRSCSPSPKTFRLAKLILL